MAVQLQFVVKHLETVFVRDLSLMLLDIQVLELDDLSAFRADQVIVVFGVIGKLIACLPVSEISRLRQAALAEEIQGAVHGRQPDIGLLPAHPLKEILRRDVPVHLQEGLQDLGALLRKLHVVPPDVLSQNSLNFRHGTSLNLILILNIDQGAAPCQVPFLRRLRIGSPFPHSTDGIARVLFLTSIADLAYDCLMQTKEKSTFPTDMEEVWETYQEDLSRVDEHIAHSLDSGVELINTVSRHILTSGGKRIRPLLTLISAHLCGYTGKDHILLAGVVEFIHTATLLHDDVLDNAETRRGKSAARTLWGNQASILAGDFLYTQSLCQSVGLANHEINRILAETVKRTCEGETSQLSHHANIDMTETEYFKIVECKTATLLGAACRLGAVIADASLSLRDAIESFGLNLGTAFQIIDDTLDYSADKNRLGKSIGNDLMEGKVTLPLLHLLTRCSASERARISGLLNGEGVQDPDLDRVIAMMREYGSIRYATIKAQDYVEKSKKHLDVFGNSLHRQALGIVADYIVSRDY